MEGHFPVSSLIGHLPEAWVDLNGSMSDLSCLQQLALKKLAQWLVADVHGYRAFGSALGSWSARTTVKFHSKLVSSDFAAGVSSEGREFWVADRPSLDVKRFVSSKGNEVKARWHILCTHARLNTVLPVGDAHLFLVIRRIEISVVR